MARVKGCGTCFKPLAECICDDEDGLVSLNPPAPVSYDGPVRDADGSDGNDAA